MDHITLLPIQERLEFFSENAAKHALRSLQNDYAAMGHMIFGKIHDFDEMLKSLLSLQDDIDSHTNLLL